MAEKNIEITVLDKVATAPSDAVVVCGNSNYSLTFVFDSEWNAETEKTARFFWRKDRQGYYKDVPINGNVVAVPILSNIVEVFVGVYAGELRTTTPARIPCRLSVLCLCEDQEEATPFIWERIQDQIGNLSELKTLHKNNLVAAINEVVESGGSGGGGGGGIVFETDETLTLGDDGVLRVNTAKDVEKDNTLPITSAAVYLELGNIEVLLAAL